MLESTGAHRLKVSTEVPLSRTPDHQRKLLVNSAKPTLPERTGWWGIRPFKVQVFVVSPNGSTLRLREWPLAERERS